MPRTGQAAHHNTYEEQDIMDRAKRESGLSNKLYNLLLEYQERFQTVQEPYRVSEKVGELNLPLSRLYNQLWDLLWDCPSAGVARKQIRIDGTLRKSRGRRKAA